MRFISFDPEADFERWPPMVWFFFSFEITEQFIWLNIARTIKKGATRKKPAGNAFLRKTVTQITNGLEGIFDVIKYRDTVHDVVKRRGLSSYNDEFGGLTDVQMSSSKIKINERLTESNSTYQWLGEAKNYRGK